VAGCDSPSQCGMACPSADQGLRLGRASVPLIRDRDVAYGAAFIRRILAMGIRDRPVSARSPWQNGYAERLIGSIRPEF
jgi:transposase InsO family protein